MPHCQSVVGHFCFSGAAYFRLRRARSAIPPPSATKVAGSGTGPATMLSMYIEFGKLASPPRNRTIPIGEFDVTVTVTDVSGVTVAKL